MSPMLLQESQCASEIKLVARYEFILFEQLATHAIVTNSIDSYA